MKNNKEEVVNVFTGEITLSKTDLENVPLDLIKTNKKIRKLFKSVFNFLKEQKRYNYVKN